MIRLESPSQRAAAALPSHLRRYVVDQEYEKYTEVEHQTWRTILGRLTSHLRDRAHPVYLQGLAATGIGVEQIPHLDEMNRQLNRFGWSAVCVRGFIPPAVFTGLQARSVLAIAADIRSPQNLEYTPAPDIVHEAAGHAPILADPRYAEYVQKCGEAGFRAIASAEDQEVYEAIRHLSVVKEDPDASPEDHQAAEERLAQANLARRVSSESTRASRLYWWTAEYGLVGSLERPLLYGAGLLSSIGESQKCLDPAVKKVPLTVACADVNYDITRMQPQLFVARDFDHLFEVLAQFEATLSWRRGGDHGLHEALVSRTVNHLVLSDGLEVAGQVTALVPANAEIAPGLRTALAVLSGPTLLSRNERAISPPQAQPAVVAFGRGRLPLEGPFALTLASGLTLRGRSINGVRVRELTARLHDRELTVPAEAELLLSEALPSVRAGAGDAETWDQHYGAPVALGDAEAQVRARKAERARRLQ